jgi:hypothetical protein
MLKKGYLIQAGVREKWRKWRKSKKWRKGTWKSGNTP